MTLYNKHGEPIAYIQEEHIINFHKAEVVGFLSSDNVFSWRDSAFLGWYEDGWILDKEAYYAFFTENAIGGPPKPRYSKSLPKFSYTPKMRKSSKLHHSKKMSTRNWSDYEDLDFF